MPDTVQSATSTAPASEAKTSDAKQGASNLTATQMVQRFLNPPANQEATAEQTTAEPSAAPEPTAAETEQQALAEAETQVAEPSETTEPEEPGAKEEADDVLSQKSSLDPKTKERIQRRIDKEVGKRKAMEARIAELEGKLSQQPAPTEEKPQVVPLPAGAPPLANIETHQGLQEIYQQAKEAVREAEDLLDVPYEQREKWVVNGQAIDPTDQAIKRALRNAKVTLEDHIPARAQFLQQQAQAKQIAHAEFPFLADKSAVEYGMVQAIYKDMPWLKNVPNADWIVGLGVEGWKAVQAKKAAAQKTKDTKPKVEPPKPPASQSAVSAGSSVRAPADHGRGATAEYEKLKAKGGVSGSEFAAFLARKELARNSA